VCADIAYGLGARIEGWSTRPKEKAREERRRKKKKPLASHHHRRKLLFPRRDEYPLLIMMEYYCRPGGAVKNRKYSCCLDTQFSCLDNPSRYGLLFYTRE
jgi:hypothetical protein